MTDDAPLQDSLDFLSYPEPTYGGRVLIDDDEFAEMQRQARERLSLEQLRTRPEPPLAEDAEEA